jgi:hypothetical protein
LRGSVTNGCDLLPQSFERIVGDLVRNVNR